MIDFYPGDLIKFSRDTRVYTHNSVDGFKRKAWAMCGDHAIIIELIPLYNGFVYLCSRTMKLFIVHLSDSDQKIKKINGTK